MCMKYNRVTKVRSRQRVKPAAVQPIVRRTGHWRACVTRKILLKNITLYHI